MRYRNIISTTSDFKFNELTTYGKILILSSFIPEGQEPA